MVGTPEYQVTRFSRIVRQKESALNFVEQRRCRRKQSGHRGTDQAVNVEQRHNAKRNIFLGQRVSIRDVRGGDREIEMRKGTRFGRPYFR